MADDLNAKVVRSRGGKMVVSDGPYIEAKECIGGFSIVDCDSLERALPRGSTHHEHPRAAPPRSARRAASSGDVERSLSHEIVDRRVVHAEQLPTDLATVLARQWRGSTAR